MLDAALDLVASGWAVIPCKWHGDNAKAPLTVNGHHDASRNPDVIRYWWGRWPQAMIGAPVPEPFIVIDIDPRNGGDLADLVDLVGPIPKTLTVWSGRNDRGKHLYFQRPPGQLTSTRLPRGIDLKVNGYCIVPPSPHPATGQPYRWDQQPGAPLPHRLRNLLRPPITPKRIFANSGGISSALTDWVANQPVHNRNEGLFWAACRLAENDQLDHGNAEDLVRAAMSTGLTETEARRTVASAAKKSEVRA